MASEIPALPLSFRCAVVVVALALVFLHGLDWLPGLSSWLVYPIFALTMLLAFNGRLGIAELFRSLRARSTRRSK